MNIKYLRVNVYRHIYFTFTIITFVMLVLEDYIPISPPKHTIITPKQYCQGRTSARESRVKPD